MENLKLITIKDFADGQKYMVIEPSVTIEDIVLHPDCPALLKNAVEISTSWQVRVETPLEKSILSPALVPQWAAALLALNTSVITGEEKTMPLNIFMENRGPRTLVKIQIPLDNADRSSADSRVGMTPSDVPIVYAAASLETKNGTIQSARVALTGAWKQTVRMVASAEKLSGKTIDIKMMQEIAEEAAKEAEPKSDFRGSENYRREMAKVAVRRALEKCVEGEK
ncbi:MAG: hypothetical protein JEZ06_13755 [Anaerolineaceae bacterium]|nr:hypothetical protein [Anaerolineaceae bacterium]